MSKKRTTYNTEMPTWPEDTEAMTNATTTQGEEFTNWCGMKWVFDNKI